MASCSHVFSTSLLPPSSNIRIYKDECTQCFDSQDFDSGIDVCLSCFNAGCLDPERHHARIHYNLTHHPLTLNIHRMLKDKPKRPEDLDEPPQKISKLAIVPESEEDKYEFITRVTCYACGGLEVERTAGQLPAVIDSVMTSMSAAKQSQIEAWEEEISACDHTRNLVQEPPRSLESQALAHCSNCDLNENLWLCLVCGNLGCGRQQYGGLGGNGHGLAHFDQTQHPISCKLGTITPEGTADIYCYNCNDAKLDPNLGQHLSNFGINVESQQKTEKSMTELQLEQNLKFNFSMVTEDGKELEPLFGPGNTGIKNLGNSCYMASVLQSLFSLDAFQQRYFPTAIDHFVHCTQEPASCLRCQLSKIADGLLSGRYSREITAEENETRGQDGIAPSMFKALIGKEHKEFSTMRQQDAFEFFQHLVTTIERKEHTTPQDDPTNIFKFSIQQRLQCMECKRVRYAEHPDYSISIPVPARKIQKQDKKDGEEDQYEPLTFDQCLRAFAADSVIEYRCPYCKRRTPATTNKRLITFPEVLVINVKRFEYKDYVPRKINAPISFPEDNINFDKFLAYGKQEDEELLPEEDANDQVDEASLNQLLSMGLFNEAQSRKALNATGNNGPEKAMNWLLDHMNDPDIDATPTGPSEDDIAMLTEMGFAPALVKKALSETSNNVERAIEWLFSHPDDSAEESISTSTTFGDASLPVNYQLTSVISHKGTSVHCGHYVAHVLKGEQWVLFNDSKVVKALSFPPGDAYIYILQRRRT